MSNSIIQTGRLLDPESVGSGSSGGGGLVLITNATVISNITDEDNWTNGVYSGDTTGLVQWNYYTDNEYEYIYDGTTLVRSDVTSDHNNLNNVQQAESGVTNGHISDEAQSIAGVKTFSSSPIVPTPTDDMEAATMKYVKDYSSTLDKKLTQAIVYYAAPNDDQIKQIKFEYLKNSALFYEQRFEYTAGAVTREEVKDDANGYWLRIDYTTNPWTFTTITAWTITI